MSTPGSVERGMTIMAAAMLFAPTMDAIAKYLSETVSPGEVSWGRFVFQTLFILPIFLVARRPMGPHLGLQALRGLMMAVTTLAFFAALQVMPIADSIAIFFVEPLILTLMSAAFLGEKIGWRRLVAVIVGFIGALIVIQPSYRIFGIESVLPLVAAIGFAAYLALTRRLAVTGDMLALQLSTGIFGGLAMTLALAIGHAGEIEVFALSWPTPFEWALMVALGAVATLAHGLIVLAFRLAPAGILAPFQYLEIISATALGYLVFADFPRAETWFGVVIIIGSGLYVFHRERLLARRAAA